MVKNYIKLAWRNLKRNKSFSSINILGLALGLTCSLLIMLWVLDEKSVDGFHANGKSLFQVYERWTFDGKTTASYPTQGLLAEELKKVFPEIEATAGTENVAGPNAANTFAANNKILKSVGLFAGPDYFKMFSFPLLQGNRQTAIEAPGTIAISEKMAIQFFNGANKAFGQTILFDNKENLKITAVFRDIPASSSQQFDFLRSWPDFKKENGNWIYGWENTDLSTYVQLKENVNVAQFEPKIKDFIYRYEQKRAGNSIELALQPYAEKYLHSNFKNGILDGGRIEYVRLFSLVAIIILLIACVNFMNLATVQSAKRAREVGLRKVIGAGRSSLIAQFLGEAVLITLLSVVIALIAANIILPFFNSITGKQLSIPFDKPLFWCWILALLLGTGLIAGSYPALFLSSLKPIKVLKGTFLFSNSGIVFRQTLVVFQFALSLILMVGMIVIYGQLNYIKTKNLGYNRENLLYIPIEGDLIQKYQLFKQAAGSSAGIVDVSKMRSSPTVIENHTGDINWPGKDMHTVISFANCVVGYDFVKTMKLELKEGRDYSREFATDSVGFIVNEAAVARMGYKHPIGETITWGNHPGRIIGVLKDFHFNSLHQAIEPLIIRLDDNWSYGTILVRIASGKTQEAIASLEKICKSLNPKFPFSFRFSDDEFTKLYKSETLAGQLANIFGFLAIFISCLGLFGLASFTAAQRCKEIGVRKVLGASVGQIVSMLNTKFLKPVAIAMAIAFPVSWFALNNWLQNFEYKIKMEWWIFALAGIIAIIIALITVSFQTIKAAIANPVKSLRSE